MPNGQEVSGLTEHFMTNYGNCWYAEPINLILRRPLFGPGLTSNMFVVEEDGAVVTAPSGILMGSMRQLCLSVCEKEDIPVRLEFPDLSRARLWKEAFLTGKH